MEEDGWARVAYDYEVTTTSRTNESRVACRPGQADPCSSDEQVDLGHVLIHLSLSVFTLTAGLVDSCPGVVES